MKKHWPVLFMTLAGAMDTVTGLLLMTMPAFTLQLMQVAIIPEDLAGMRFVGAFVFSIGTSYLLPWFSPTGPMRSNRFASALRVTRWVRVCIATFTTIAILTGVLHLSWISVPITDALLAAVQTWMLQRKTFETGTST